MCFYKCINIYIYIYIYIYKLYTAKPIYTYYICMCTYLAFGSPVPCLVADCILRLVPPPFLLLVLAFNSASVFNSDLSSWDVSSVTSMQYSKWKAAPAFVKENTKDRGELSIVVGRWVRVVVGAGRTSPTR